MLTKEEMPACPVATTVALIGSKWKLLIMRNLIYSTVTPPTKILRCCGNPVFTAYRRRRRLNRRRQASRRAYHQHRRQSRKRRASRWICRQRRKQLQELLSPDRSIQRDSKVPCLFTSINSCQTVFPVCNSIVRPRPSEKKYAQIYY